MRNSEAGKWEVAWRHSTAKDGVELTEICVENEIQWWVKLEMRLQTPMPLVPGNEWSRCFGGLVTEEGKLGFRGVSCIFQYSTQILILRNSVPRSWKYWPLKVHSCILHWTLLSATEKYLAQGYASSLGWFVAKIWQLRGYKSWPQWGTILGVHLTAELPWGFKGKHISGSLFPPPNLPSSLLHTVSSKNTSNKPFAQNSSSPSKAI